MPKRGTIVFVAVLLDTTDTAEIADALNETLRPARLDTENSAIVDYAFNLGKDTYLHLKESAEKLPLPVPYNVHPSYEEGNFYGMMQDHRKLEREAGLAIMDQVADVIAARDEMQLEDVQQEILKAGCQELYEAHIDPAIDDLAQVLEDRRKGGPNEATTE